MVVSGRRHRIMRMREGCVGCNPVEQQQDGRWWATLIRSCMFVPFARWWFSVLVGLLGWGELRGGLWGGGWGGGLRRTQEREEGVEGGGSLGGCLVQVTGWFSRDEGC